MMGGYIVFTLLFLLVNGVFSAETDEVKVMEGDSVTLKTGVTKDPDDNMMWYFEDTRIAQINVEASKSCLYDGEDGRFRDRLEMDYETGSLTITNIRSEHAGRYEVQLNIKKSLGTSQSLNRNRKCGSTKITRKSSSTHDDTIKTFSVSVTVADPDKTNKAAQMAPNEQETDMTPGSGLSSGAVAGIVAVLLGFAASAVGVTFYRLRSS